MIVTYKPDNGEHRRWDDFDPEDLLGAEVKAIEKALKTTLPQFTVQLQAGSYEARCAALWVLLKRENPQLRYAEVEPRPREITVEFNRAERAELRRKVAKMPIDDEQRDLIFAQLDIEDAEDDEEPPVEQQGPKGA